VVKTYILGVLATIVENCKNLDHFGGCEKGLLVRGRSKRRSKRRRKSDDDDDDGDDGDDLNLSYLRQY
jgi:hypothetical protein